MTGTEGSGSVGRRDARRPRLRVLDAAKACCERWGIDQGHDRRHRRRERGVAGDDVPPVPRRQGRAVRGAAGARARGVLRELARSQVEGADVLEDLLVRTVVAATRELRADEHLALMLASEPGEALGQLTVDGLPRIIRFADALRSLRSSSAYLPRAERAAAHRRARPPHHLVLPRPERRSSTSATRRRRARFLAPVIAVLAPSTAAPHRSAPSASTGALTMTHHAVDSNEAIIGRDDINDIEAILSITNTDVDEVEHVVKDNADAIFTWDYSLARPQLRKLYEKAKVGQWNATTDLPWDTEVDLEKVVAARPGGDPAGPRPRPLRRHGRREVGRQGVARRSASTSGAGRCRSSSTASRARCCARPRSPRRCRGTTPSSTPRRRWSTRPATSRCSPATSTRSWAAATRSTPTCGCCSTTSSTTAAGT